MSEDQKPFTEREQKIVELLSEACELFLRGETNDHERSIFRDALEKQKYCLMMRVARRDYPNLFETD